MLHFKTDYNFTTNHDILVTLGLQHHCAVLVPFEFLSKEHVIEFIEVR